MKKNPLVSYSGRLKEYKTSYYPVVLQSLPTSCKYFMLSNSLFYIVVKFNFTFLKSDIPSQCTRNWLQGVELVLSSVLRMVGPGLRAVVSSHEQLQKFSIVLFSMCAVTFFKSWRKTVLSWILLWDQLMLI